LSEWPPERYEQQYLSTDDPRAQSGFRGDEARWESARRPIVEAIHQDGTFLDVGCANGLLMECVVAWSEHRIQPYGLDFSPKLVELARRRLPQWADRIFLGDVHVWEPPRRFDFVRTELEYSDEPRRLVDRLLERFVSPGGRLILCGYGSRRGGPPPSVRQLARVWGFEPKVELAREGIDGALLELAAIGVPATS
jgi:SAM-dependent methyltransferase